MPPRSTASRRDRPKSRGHASPEHRADPRANRTAGSILAATIALVVLAALAAHLVFRHHAGGLWRDESNTAAFATMPSLGAIAAALRYDSVPLVSTLAVRAWTAVGLGSDGGLRVFGLAVGLAILAALFLSARATRAVWPSASLALLALNAWVIRGGDALRPMGLGMLFAVLAFAALARALERVTPVRVAFAAIAAALAVHTVYSNAPLVGAMALAGAGAGLLARSRARVLASLGVGAFAALSLVPYAGAVRAASAWGVMVQFHPDLGRFTMALAATSDWDRLVWMLLVGGGVAIAAVRLVRRKAGADSPERMIAGYAGLTLVLGAALFIGFLFWTKLATQPWYYLPIMALAAASLDTLYGPLLRGAGARLAAVGVLVLVTAGHAFTIVPRLAIRQTDLDLVADTLQTRVTARDLVVVTPWYLGVTFHRYYHGAAPWLTLPPLADSRIHRYDLVMQAMQDPPAADSVSRAIARTFDAGGRLYLVGSLPQLTPGETPAPPPRAPAPGFGWNIDTYGDAWGKRVEASFVGRLATAEPIAIPTGTVNEYESVPLFVLTSRPAPSP